MIYILLGVLILVEIISGIEVVRSVNRTCNADNQGMDERTDIPNNSELLSVCGRDRMRSGDSVDYLKLDDEAVKGILTVMRMSVKYSPAERMALDYCYDRLEGEEEC